jgi:homoserine O-succinyltransferase
MDRYLRGETEMKPVMPRGYFGAEAETELRAMDRSAHGDRRRAQIEDISVIDALAPAEPAWREAAIAFYRSWLEMMANTDLGSRAPLRAVTDEFASLQSLS